MNKSPGAAYLIFNFNKKKKVIISLDRYLSVKLPNWNKKYLTPVKALIVGFLVILVFSVLNFNVWFTYGTNVLVNETVSTKCYSAKSDPPSSWKSTWSVV